MIDVGHNHNFAASSRKPGGENHFEDMKRRITNRFLIKPKLQISASETKLDSVTETQEGLPGANKSGGSCIII